MNARNLRNLHALFRGDASPPSRLRLPIFSFDSSPLYIYLLPVTFFRAFNLPIVLYILYLSFNKKNTSLHKANCVNDIYNTRNLQRSKNEVLAMKKKEKKSRECSIFSFLPRIEDRRKLINFFHNIYKYCARQRKKVLAKKKLKRAYIRALFSFLSSED